MSLPSRKNIIPILNTLKNYNKSNFKYDLISGINVSVLLIPQGMAYALLAGVPPIYGLYTGLIPLLIYALFGTSRQLSIGPVAVSALLVLAGISKIAVPGSAEYISYVITCGLLIGIVQIILAAFRMGFLANFLSHPVIAGFTSAAAIIISITQLKDFLGMDIPREFGFIETVQYAFANISSIHGTSFLVAMIALVVMFALRKINRSIPAALIVVILGTVLCYGLTLFNKGLDIVAEVPEGLPNFILPDFSINTIRLLIPTVITVTIVGIVESISIAKALESKHKNYTIRPNQELFSLGMAKVLGSVFQSIPSSASFSRSALNSNSNAKTTVSSLIAAVIVAVVLVFFTPLFYYLPKAVLAAIIVLSAMSLFDWKEAKNLWKTHRADFTMMAVTFFSCFLFGIDHGVFIGVALSIFAVLYRTSRPHVAILGKIPGTNYYRNADRFQETEGLENTLIIRWDEQLFFANAAYFKEKIKKLVEQHPEQTNKVLIDASNMSDIDSSGIHALRELDDSLEEAGIDLYLCGARGPIRDMLAKSGLLTEHDKHHINIFECVEFLKGNTDLPCENKAMQNNPGM